MFRNVSIAIASAALMIGTSAAAQERETRTVGVTAQDLDLTTEHGQAELARRIDYAARQACGVNERQVGSNIRSREARECYRTAKRDLEQRFAEAAAERNRAG
ncbi:MAG: UrcA family protein [Alteraurantiacibacter sp.]|nr:UrcA family protein [Alteraurantiacibacter sp.]